VVALSVFQESGDELKRERELDWQFIGEPDKEQTPIRLMDSKSDLLVFWQRQCRKMMIEGLQRWLKSDSASQR
jgi:hypothetical protein